MSFFAVPMLFKWDPAQLRLDLRQYKRVLNLVEPLN